MRDDATIYLTEYLTEDQIETILKHFGRTDKPEDLEDYEVRDLVDQLIDELI